MAVAGLLSDFRYVMDSMDQTSPRDVGQKFGGKNIVRFGGRTDGYRHCFGKVVFAGCLAITATGCAKSYEQEAAEYGEKWIKTHAADLAAKRALINSQYSKGELQFSAEQRGLMVRAEALQDATHNFMEEDRQTVFENKEARHHSSELMVAIIRLEEEAFKEVRRQGICPNRGLYDESLRWMRCG